MYADNLRSWACWLLAAGSAAMGLTLLASSRAMSNVGLSATATLWTMATVAFVAWIVEKVRDHAQRAVIDRYLERDPTICFATDTRGLVQGCNAAAVNAGFRRAQSAAIGLGLIFAEPDAVVRRLLRRAEIDGSASTEVAGKEGPVRLVVHDARRGLLLWRIELGSLAESPPTFEPDVALPSRRGRVRFEDVPIPLIIFAETGKVLTANALAREILDMPVGERATISDLFEGLGRSLTAWLQDVATGRLPTAGEVLRIRRAQDSHVHLSLRRTEERGRTLLVGVLIDATAVRVLEAQFIQSQKMQAIGQLAGGVAHDFNNLLTAISGHCDLLLLRHDPGDPEYSDMMQIHQNANRAASLVGQLLAFSRKQTQKLETLEVQEVLSDLAHLLNRLVGERVKLSLAHGTGIGPVHADRRQLEQVIMNLVVNARDAIRGNGPIRIETEALTLEKELRRNRAVVPPGDYAAIRVIDQGEGIAPDHLEKIFEPFFTTKRPGEGTGLGLSTVYGIVKQTGGYIFVDSAQGQGSTFHLYFPITAERVVPPAPVATPMQCQGDGVILLVEDEASVRAFASRALRLRGYTVLEAGSAEEALELLDDPSLAVDVFVTDVVMPGLDGPSWVRKALEQRPEVRIVFVSGYAQEAFADEQEEITNSVFLPKPFSLNDLTQTVQRLLH